MSTWNRSATYADDTLSNVDPTTGRAALGAVGYADEQFSGPIVLSLNYMVTESVCWRPGFSGTLTSVACQIGGYNTVGASLVHFEVNGTPITAGASLAVSSGESVGSTPFATSVSAGGEFSANSTVMMYVTGLGEVGNVGITLGWIRMPP